MRTPEGDRYNFNSNSNCEERATLKSWWLGCNFSVPHRGISG
jgi:hypothetical protein